LDGHWDLYNDPNGYAHTNFNRSLHTDFHGHGPGVGGNSRSFSQPRDGPGTRTSAGHTQTTRLLADDQGLYPGLSNRE
jgi:hypothetical protein